MFKNSHSQNGENFVLWQVLSRRWHHIPETRPQWNKTVFIDISLFLVWREWFNYGGQRVQFIRDFTFGENVIEPLAQMRRNFEGVITIIKYIKGCVDNPLDAVCRAKVIIFQFCFLHRNQTLLNFLQSCPNCYHHYYCYLSRHLCYFLCGRWCRLREWTIFFACLFKVVLTPKWRILSASYRKYDVLFPFHEFICPCLEVSAAVAVTIQKP